VSDDAFSFPDMDDMMRQMQDAMDDAQDAMEEARDAMDELPEMLGQLGGVMDSLSGVMGGLPEQLGDLTGAMDGFAGRHADNVETLIGEPDWGLSAEIRIGEMLHLNVRAVFDLEKAVQTWQSTQRGDFEAVVGAVVEENASDLEPGMMDQILGQLKQGRGMARVEEIEVLICKIAGAPSDAADRLQLSPEANIPLAVTEAGISFEFAPLLTIRNDWEHADLPVFAPMGEQVVVPLTRFDPAEAFQLPFTVSDQDAPLTLLLHFRPLP